MAQILNRIRIGMKPLLMSRKARAVTDEGLTYLSASKFRRITAALRDVQCVPGDFVEFGVALGGSAIVIAHQANGRRFHGFDVFAMIPEPSSEKDDEKSRRRYQAIKSGASQGIKGATYYGYRTDLFSEVKEAFARHGVPVDGEKVLLHQGLFEETLPSAELGTLAFVHLDCDWYDPVKFCLDSIADKLSPKGVIVVDDYHDYGGCRTAVDEFLSRRSDYSLEEGPNPVLRRTI